MTSTSFSTIIQTAPFSYETAFWYRTKTGKFDTFAMMVDVSPYINHSIDKLKTANLIKQSYDLILGSIISDINEQFGEKMACELTECILQNDTELSTDDQEKIKAGICPFPEHCPHSTKFEE
ncbi:MAG: hypothetical protein M0R80_09825 [Proteobacteria bacterium]|jgi:hypothetical protein|nr:hypothetical protein [Pseudomonadota bacterium]